MKPTYRKITFEISTKDEALLQLLDHGGGSTPNDTISYKVEDAEGKILYSSPDLRVGVGTINA